PAHPLELLAVEEMDDDGDGAPQREPEQGGVEESHLEDFHHKVTKTTKTGMGGLLKRLPLGALCAFVVQVHHVSLPRMERRPARYFVSSTSRSWSVEIRT